MQFWGPDTDQGVELGSPKSERDILTPRQEAILECCFPRRSHFILHINHTIFAGNSQTSSAEQWPRKSRNITLVLLMPDQWLGYPLVYCSNQEKQIPLQILCLPGGTEQTGTLTTPWAAGEVFLPQCYGGQIRAVYHLLSPESGSGLLPSTLIQNALSSLV